MRAAIPPQDDQDLIDQEASEWLLQAETRGLSPDEQAQFDLWRKSDPRCEETYSALLRTWNDIAEIPGLADLAPIEAETVAPPKEEPRATWWKGKRIPAVAAASIAASFLALLIAQPSVPPADSSFATELAQLRKLRLEDGTIVTLGPKSHLDVRFSGSERRVALNGGEAFFEVAHNKTRPFLVEVDQSTVRVVGTKFDVNHGAGGLRVSVLEGHVQVRPRTSGAVYDLRAGQSFELNSAAAAGADPNIMTVSTAGSWRTGRLTYDNTRLGDVVADINRYHAPGVSVDSKADDLRITASFRPDEVDQFLNTLGDAMPVEVDQNADGSIRLESR